MFDRTVRPTGPRSAALATRGSRRAGRHASGMASVGKERPRDRLNIT